jgi:ketosteroid isomerase-like protein
MLSQAELVRQAIEQANRNFEATYRSGDAQAVARLYTEGAQLFPTGSEPITGVEAIVQFWQGVMDLGISRATLETKEVDDQGHTAIEVGSYTLFGDDNHVLDCGKYMVVWKQARGEWKLHRDIWNTSVAPRQ